MANAAGRDIKIRMRSIDGTCKITKAMGLVASSKIIKAKERVERSRPYFQIMYETLCEIASSVSDFNSPYLTERESNTACVVVIGGDRGLAGGYNSNLYKKVAEVSRNKAVKLLPVGKKCIEHYDRQVADIISREYTLTGELTIEHCFDISRSLCDAFLRNEFDEIILVYTNFISMLEQAPADIRLLPVETKASDDKLTKSAARSVMYEPSGEAVYDAIIPEYVAGLIFCALCEASAAEQGARRTAMDSATKNAEEMLDTLSLQYNRARQGAITQEITEIIAGTGE